MVISELDMKFMHLAFKLAEKGSFTTTPNPRVGCVLVKDGEIIGQGWHERAGCPHAEINALQDVYKRWKEQAKAKICGATAYVTLEPCSHFGCTPPCAKALVEAGVARVVIGNLDPNPLVAGRGVAMLCEAGIAVDFEVLPEIGLELNRGFFKRMLTKKPYVQLKTAISLDGRTAMKSGESKWITNELSRADVQKLRAMSCAILSTSSTVLQDDPLLNVRYAQLPTEVKEVVAEAELRQPVRVILDNHHRISPNAKIFSVPNPSPVWLVSHKERDLSTFPKFCQQIILPNSEAKIDLLELLKALGKREINYLWLEAGATLTGEFIGQNLVDELIVYIAPQILGSSARGFCNLDLEYLNQASNWRLNSLKNLNDDIKLIYLSKFKK